MTRAAATRAAALRDGSNDGYVGSRVRASLSAVRPVSLPSRIDQSYSLPATPAAATQRWTQLRSAMYRICNLRIHSTTVVRCAMKMRIRLLEVSDLELSYIQQKMCTWWLDVYIERGTRTQQGQDMEQIILRLSIKTLMHSKPLFR